MRKINYVLLLIFSIAVFTSCENDSAAPLPTAGFSADKLYTIIGENVMFANSSEDAVEFRWDFGDGQTSALQNPTVSFTENGTYTVTLTAINEDGKEKTASVQITVDYLYLQQIIVKNIPWADSNGDLWDGGLFGDDSGPDLVFAFGANLDNVTPTLSDVTQTMIDDICGWNVNNVKVDDAIWQFGLYDQDASDYEQMLTWAFNPTTYAVPNSDSSDEFFRTVSLLNSNSSVCIELVASIGQTQGK